MSTDNYRCANCGNTASIACGACFEGLDANFINSLTAYCSEACQIKHSVAHEPDCRYANYHKQVYRAGGFIQIMFYISRKLAFDLKVAKVSMKDGCLYVEEGKPGENEILIDFPKAMFEDGADKEDRKREMILAWNSCGEAVERMQKVVSKALDGTYSKLEEVKVRIPEGRCRVVSMNGKEETPTHTVFKVHLKDGNSYAFDLAGAQYGRFQPVTSWTDFEKDMVAEVLEYRDFGWYAKMQGQDDDHLRKMQARGKRVPLSYEDLLNVVQRTVTDCMNSVVDTRLAVLKMSAAELFNGESEQTFEKSMDLQLLAESTVKGYVAWLKADGQKEILRGDPNVFNKFVAVKVGDEEAIENHRIVEEWREKKYAEEAEEMARLVAGYKARGATVYTF